MLMYSKREIFRDERVKLYFVLYSETRTLRILKSRFKVFFFFLGCFNMSKRAKSSLTC